MNPIVSKIKKVPQSNASHMDWKEARYNKTRHFLVRLGEYIPGPKDHIDGHLPDWLNRDLMKEKGYCFSINQVFSLTNVTENK